jgi:hypothetical protein
MRLLSRPARPAETLRTFPGAGQTPQSLIFPEYVPKPALILVNIKARLRHGSHSPDAKGIGPPQDLGGPIPVDSKGGRVDKTRCRN